KARGPRRDALEELTPRDRRFFVSFAHRDPLGWSELAWRVIFADRRARSQAIVWAEGQTWHVTGRIKAGCYSSSFARSERGRRLVQSIYLHRLSSDWPEWPPLCLEYSR